jgi:hypothetical protein
VCGWEGVGVVESIWRPYSVGVEHSVSDQIQNLHKIAGSPQTKKLGGEGALGLGISEKKIIQQKTE